MSIDPGVADMDGIYLFNIDSLESVVENKAQREEEARRAEPIIHDAIEELLDKLSYFDGASNDGTTYGKKQNAFAVVDYIAH